MAGAWTSLGSVGRHAGRLAQWGGRPSSTTEKRLPADDELLATAEDESETDGPTRSDLEAETVTVTGGSEDTATETDAASGLQAGAAGGVFALLASLLLL